MNMPIREPGAATAAKISAPLMNVIGALLLLALSAWLWIDAANIESAGDATLGADTFPRMVAALMALCCLILLAQSLRAFLAQSSARISFTRPWQVLASVGLVCIYPVLIDWLGYYVATPIWMVPFLLLAGMRNPIAVAASTAGFLLFTKVLFQTVLAIPMP